MEPETNYPEEQPKSRLYCVTPLSKYLAMALFVALPFVGGYVGYVYAPQGEVAVATIGQQTYLDSCTTAPELYCVETKIHKYSGGFGFSHQLQASSSTGLVFEASSDRTVELVASSSSERFYEVGGARYGANFGTTLPQVSDDGSYMAYVEDNIIYVVDTVDNELALLDELALDNFSYTYVVGLNKWNPSSDKILFGLIQEYAFLDNNLPSPASIMPGEYNHGYNIIDLENSRVTKPWVIQPDAQFLGWIAEDIALFDHHSVLYELDTEKYTYKPSEAFGSAGEIRDHFRYYGEHRGALIYAESLSAESGTDLKLIVREKGEDTIMGIVGWSDTNNLDVLVFEEYIEIHLHNDAADSFQYYWK